MFEAYHAVKGAQHQAKFNSLSARALGYHLAARIKTGYFCSYNPHPDRPVTWRF